MKANDTNKTTSIPSLKEREGLWAVFSQQKGKTSVHFETARDAAKAYASGLKSTSKDMFASTKDFSIPVVTQANSEKANKLLSTMMKENHKVTTKAEPKAKTDKPYQHSFSL